MAVHAVMATQTKMAVIPLSPTTGQTVAFFNDSRDQMMFLTPAGLLLTLIITLPSDSTTAIGQVVGVCTSQAITTVTLTGAGTILNSVASMAIGDAVTYMKVATNTWIRI